MTLDEHLREVDRWKDAVYEQMAPLSPEERARVDADAIAWLEVKLGRALDKFNAVPPNRQPRPR